MIGVLLPSVRRLSTNAGWSVPNEVQKAITCAALPLIRVATLLIVLSPWVNDSESTILPPSCWKRSVKAWQTFWK